jgi:5-oxoprolinase (ATP-hydrolysing)/N-methylhydantoinase A
LVKDPAGNVAQDCGTGELVTLTTTDRIVEVQLAGGSGYGDPRERQRALLDDDVSDGYVSPSAAATEYGGQTPSASAAE